jgi:AraC family transcriptional activator of pobA
MPGLVLDLMACLSHAAAGFSNGRHPLFLVLFIHFEPHEAMMSTQTQVSIYGLYGEETPEDDLKFVHIEAISTRSTLYDWQIKPHAHHGMFQLLFLAGGGAKVRIDKDLHNIVAPAVICIPGGTVHGFEFFPQTEGWVLTLGDSLLNARLDPRARALIHPLLVAPVVTALNDAPKTVALIGTMLDRIADEFTLPRPGGGAMLDGMIQIILLEIGRRQQPQNAPTGQRKRHLQFQRFRELLEQNYKSHWTIDEYAAQMGLTPARLNRLCRAMTGKTVGTVIQDRLVLEAQRLLTYTNATATMVAFETGFREPAYFSRFFKRRTGLSPVAYRKMQEHQD